MTTPDDFNFNAKVCLVRVDFNVPQDDQLRVLDDTRIKAALPTLRKIIAEGGKAVLMSHLGRPKGVVSDKYSLKNIIPSLENVLGASVHFSQDILGSKAQQAIRSLKNGEVLLLENLRFYKEEEQGDENFSRDLAQLGDFYVNDAFGAAHRTHASTAVIAKFFPNAKCFGYLMAKELKAIDQVMKNGENPVTAILGGAKVSSKIDIIENILPVIDHLLIGGGMAYTFIKAQGGKIGDSIVEEDRQELALSLLESAHKKNVQVYLPLDVVVADAFNNEANRKEISIRKIPKGWQGLDIGSRSIEIFSKVIESSQTILWNGPLGVFEMPNFSKGTLSVAQAVAKTTSRGAFSLVGGGDSVSAVKQFHYESKVSYVSTGGGAMLESLEGKMLPGVAAMLNS
ncbi:phosphoglycerate kinase [Bacteroidetes bacterium endosymbiont of Geopemphigus sp.]|uniref:phosphoglycerate kinase n=1 Tax=Bacteroidetes bacterium endosymbiont of Geopemphigus sp. TaxID=2047937 RepID=UPI000CD176E9|nr:phosphoglycerate kinase [Bacteroidetes bacterium endosymbiont of Geopemphigus sp.]